MNSILDVAKFFWFAVNPILFIIDFAYLSRRKGLPEAYTYSRTPLVANHLIRTIAQSFRILLKPVLLLWIVYIYRFSRAWHHSSDSIIQVLAALLAADLVFYVWHRTAHNFWPIWRAHQIHHQDTHYNFSTAQRVGIAEDFTLNPFQLVPILFGLSPKLFFLAMSVNNLYMSYLHSSLSKMPRWIEFLFNTPSNHRKHHELGPMSGRCNYGSVLMIWDHLFGTYRKEERLVENFGVKGVSQDLRPFAHQIAGWFTGQRNFSIGRNIENIFTKPEFIALYLSLMGLGLSVYADDRLATIPLLLLILGMEFYQQMSKFQKNCFWILEVLAGIWGAARGFHVLQDLEKDFSFLLILRWFNFVLPFIFALMIHRTWKAKTPPLS